MSNRASGSNDKTTPSQPSTSAVSNNEPSAVPTANTPISRRQQTRRMEAATLQFSPRSTGAVPDSMWCGGDFLTGSGMVILQPSTKKMLLVYDTHRKHWFLPKGRKDVGESLEQAALREAHEESGYRATFLPVFSRTRQPLAPENRHGYHPDTEPIFMSTQAFLPRRNKPGKALEEDYGGEYITSWYVGQIPGDAVHETGTGMPDEINYTSHLLTYPEALQHLGIDYRRRCGADTTVDCPVEPNVEWHVAREAIELHEYTLDLKERIAKHRVWVEEHPEEAAELVRKKEQAQLQQIDSDDEDIAQGATEQATSASTAIG